ncbi:MAG: hypothetical protein MK100_09010, partial [Phycisphaerales bacterium]|nr:hypothetical protein [Phycisphaerales bacterium]
SSAELNACTFSSNGATKDGGAVANVGSTTLIDTCVFSNNTTTTGSGGAMHTKQTSIITLHDCQFTQNTSSSTGGGLYNNGSTIMMDGCNFTGNASTTTGGGGMYSLTSLVTANDCTFTGNSALSGAGLFNNRPFGDGSVQTTLNNCVFSNNMTPEWGGGVFNNNCSPTFNSCSFTDNTADLAGGAIYNASGSDAVFSFCTISNNHAGVSGGGLFSLDSLPTLSDCTMCENSPEHTNDQAFADGGGNCISVLCGDTDGDGTADCDDICSGHDDNYDSDNDGTPDGCDPDTEWYVTPDDDLQSVINGATAGQSIILAAGEYLITDGPIQIDTAPLSMIADGTVTLRATDDAHSIFVVANDIDDGMVVFEGLTLLGPLDSEPFNGNGSTMVTSGGALNIASGFVSMHQCAMSNFSAEYGGAVAVGADALLVLSECVVFDNLATVSGGGVFVEESGVLEVTNSVVCANAPDQIAGNYEASPGSCFSDECSDEDGDGLPDGCETEPDCPTDLDGDGFVSGSDLAVVLGAWGSGSLSPADFDGDGDVDGADLAILLGSWGICQ